MNPPPKRELANFVFNKLTQFPNAVWVLSFQRDEVVAAIRNGHSIYVHKLVLETLKAMPQWLLIAPYIDEVGDEAAKKS